VPLTDAIFQWLEQPEHSAVTSSVTMTELLVQPYRESGEQRVDEFYALLSTYPNLEWISPNLEIADIAARNPRDTPVANPRRSPSSHRCPRTRHGPGTTCGASK